MLKVVWDKKVVPLDNFWWGFYRRRLEYSPQAADSHFLTCAESKGSLQAVSSAASGRPERTK